MTITTWMIEAEVSPMAMVVSVTGLMTSTGAQTGRGLASTVLQDLLGLVLLIRLLDMHSATLSYQDTFQVNYFEQEEKSNFLICHGIMGMQPQLSPTLNFKDNSKIGQQRLIMGLHSLIF
jgi:hypothetical protein